MRCPGQDKAFWKPDDIFEVPCPACGSKVEFFKDDIVRRCTCCSYRVKNPKLDLGCLEWCAYGKYCNGSLGGGIDYDMINKK